MDDVIDIFSSIMTADGRIMALLLLYENPQFRVYVVCMHFSVLVVQSCIVLSVGLDRDSVP
jgi:hypothetical protein